MKTTLPPSLMGLLSAQAEPALQTVAPAAASVLQRPNAALTARPAPSNDVAPPRTAQLPAATAGGPGGAGGDPGQSRWGLPQYARLAAGVGGAALAAYGYDKTANHFFLSTTALHDGKGGFTSNERLERALDKAQTYRRAFHAAPPEAQPEDARPPAFVRRVGQNEFVTMEDFRAATKSEVADAANTPEARQRLVNSLECFTGQHIQPERVAQYGLSHVPADFDLTRSEAFSQKNKYALTGVPNPQTGASGYTSRSLTQPFVNQGMKHFLADNEARGLTAQQCMKAFQEALSSGGALSPEAQVAAGQFILNFRQVFAHPEHWGDAERVVLAKLKELGRVSAEEADKIDATLLFEDPDKSVLTRNTSLAGPVLHQIDTAIKSALVKGDPEAEADILAAGKQKNLEGLPIMSVKVNEQGNGFEDCSGLGYSFTSLNAASCMYFARLLSGQEQMSKEEVKVLIACLNAVYDDASSVRHTLQEIAHGCFVGAGYTGEDADAYYAEVCERASKTFYGGKQLLEAPTDTPADVDVEVDVNLGPTGEP